MVVCYQGSVISSNRLLKNTEFVIPNGVCEVRNLSFLGLLSEEKIPRFARKDGHSFFRNLLSKPAPLQPSARQLVIHH
jgi:hypothetical protein